MKKILVPTDFKPPSRAASEYAASLAVHFNAAIHLVHVYMEPATGVEIPAEWTVPRTELKAENAKKLNKEITYLRDKYPIAVDGEVAHGFISDTIVDAANEIGAEVLVMGMKREGEQLFGSTVTATLRKTSIPVLVIPEAYIFRPIKKIVYASDFDTTITSALFPLLFQIIEKFRAALQIIHVQKKESFLKAEEFAGKMQVERVFSKVRHSYKTLQNTDVDEAIGQYVEGRDYDLLVMMAHRHNVFERLLHKPHTKAMVYKSKLPMLVLKG